MMMRMVTLQQDLNPDARGTKSHRCIAILGIPCVVIFATTILGRDVDSRTGNDNDNIHERIDPGFRMHRDKIPGDIPA